MYTNVNKDAASCNDKPITYIEFLKAKLSAKREKSIQEQLCAGKSE